MLRLFTNIKFLNEENRSHVFPLVFDLFYSKSKFLTQFYSLTDDIDNSDIIILPLEYAFMHKNYNKYLIQFFNKTKNYKKPIWIYSGGDFGISLNDEQIYNFRLGGFKSKLNKHTIILPSFVADPYKKHLKGNFKPLRKEAVPKIGFVGHAKGTVQKYIKEFVIYLGNNLKRIFKIEYADYQSFYPSSIKRAKYLNYLKLNKNLKTDFIFRDKYRAGIKAEEDKADTTKEFFKNIYENPYTFCMRGSGNFSVRFYEVLAVGRIPVLLDTDCLLPLDGIINWNEHCVFINDPDYNSLNNEIVNFHNNITDEAFIKLQESNRKLWEDILTRHSFFKIIHNLFLAKRNEHEA